MGPRRLDRSSARDRGAARRARPFGTSTATTIIRNRSFFRRPTTIASSKKNCRSSCSKRPTLELHARLRRLLRRRPRRRQRRRIAEMAARGLRRPGRQAFRAGRGRQQGQMAGRRDAGEIRRARGSARLSRKRSRRRRAPTATFPPDPNMIGRADRREELVAAILGQERPIVVPGALGMGKTTLALAAAHDPAVVERFGAERRFFVNLEPVARRRGRVARARRTRSGSTPPARRRRWSRPIADFCAAGPGAGDPRQFRDAVAQGRRRRPRRCWGGSRRSRGCG